MNQKIESLYLDYIKFLELNNKPTTILNTKRKFKNYILPFFGQLTLKEIDTNKYIEFNLKLKELNYSSSFYTRTQSIMRCFYDYLELLYNVENIPKKASKLLCYKSDDQPVKNIWTKKEFKQFINKVDDRIYKALFNVLFYTGIRKGEALALKISDLSNSTLLITKTLTKEHFNGKRIFLTPKNGKIRCIRLDYFTNRILLQLIKYYKRNYDTFNKDFYLFGGVNPIATTTLDRKKNEYCDIADVKRIRIHDFRHSHATMLYKNRIKIKLIQKRLGHSDISTTLNTYIHVSENEEKRLIRTINLLRL